MHQPSNDKRGLKESLRAALTIYFLQPAALAWYLSEHVPSTALAWYFAENRTAAERAAAAADDFVSRSRSADITPSPFFDPAWFRENYEVKGPNAFLDYLDRKDRRFAWPSSFFAARWYARRYIGRSGVHPFLHYLTDAGGTDPHPLIDQAFLASQNGAWTSPLVAFEFLTDPEKFSLKPHPLFDSEWYLVKNPDVAQAVMNPLAHYLQYGHRENRNPNRIFNVAWYRDCLVHIPRKKRTRIDPLTHYVTLGVHQRHPPAPGLNLFAALSSKLLAHGPANLIERLNSNKGAYTNVTLAANINPTNLRKYMPEPLQQYNPDLPERILILKRPRVAVMYSARCASARIVFWWLQQAGVLASALRYSSWPHDFESIFRESRDHIAAALDFAPENYSIYKFVRHPVHRLVSTFNHLLHVPDSYGLPMENSALSFNQFLDQVQETNYFSGNLHASPQVTALEKTGRLRLTLLKIENGVETHLRAIEWKHGLPPEDIDATWEIKQILRQHMNAGEWGRRVLAGPDREIPFGRTPDYRMLADDQAKRKIYALYRDDFEAYGYTLE